MNINRLSNRPARSGRRGYYRSYNRVRDSRSLSSVKKLIKDALEDTTTTEEAIEAVEQIVQDQPADLVVPAVVEVLGETVDLLEEAVGNSSLDELDEVSDSEKTYYLGDFYDAGDVKGTIVDVQFNDDDVTLTLDVTDENGDVKPEFVHVDYEDLGI